MNKLDHVRLSDAQRRALFKLCWYACTEMWCWHTPTSSDYALERRGLVARILDHRAQFSFALRPEGLHALVQCERFDLEWAMVCRLQGMLTFKDKRQVASPQIFNSLRILAASFQVGRIERDERIPKIKLAAKRYVELIELAKDEGL